MNKEQMAHMQNFVRVLESCEDVGLTFSHTHLRLDVEDDESHYLENLSAEKLSTLLNFISGCGVFFPKDEIVSVEDNGE